jgi:hypothetical protein
MAYKFVGTGKIAYLVFIGIYLSSFTVNGQNFSLKLGSSMVAFETIQNKTDTILFLNLHSNETTSIKAIKQVLPKYFGKFIGLRNGGKREVRLSENGMPVVFDPNRIFTQLGIGKTLRYYACYSESNVKLLKSFSSELIKNISMTKHLIALHNINDGGFSAKSTLKQKLSNKDALDVYVNPERDEDDFYYVTEKSKFDSFKKLGYNVILQDNERVEDDGSLSVWCGKNGIDYINIECQDGHLQEQIQMIREVFNILTRKQQ